MPVNRPYKKPGKARVKPNHNPNKKSPFQKGLQKIKDTFQKIRGIEYAGYTTIKSAFPASKRKQRKRK